MTRTSTTKKEEETLSAVDAIFSFIKRNFWSILVAGVLLITSWVTLNSKVDQAIRDIQKVQQTHTEDVKKIKEDIQSMQSVNNIILQQLSSINAKLELLIDGKIK